MKFHWIVIALLPLCSGVALADPHAGHAAMAQSELLKPVKKLKPEEMPLSGTVLKVQQVSEYSYLEVNTGKGKLWLAAPRTELKPGQRIRFEEGDTMQNFESRLLKRTFPSIMFIGQLAVQ